jgi:tRNA-dihydrouridine synthase A
MDRLVSVAPMMDWTDRHCRFFHRLLSRRTLLYTEMLTSSAVIHGDRQRLLRMDPAERPVALQLGGSEPEELAKAARIAEDCGYDEINLNVGCPSDRVQRGRFGACLMHEPDTVAECVAAMVAAVRVPVTVKTRTGVDQRDRYEDLADFVAQVSTAGCQVFVLHARKAWLQGLSPKQNRELPPLCYPLVHRLKRDFPKLTVILNGGIRSLDQGAAQLPSVDGFMLGRAAYHDPYLLAEVDRRFFGATAPSTGRSHIVRCLLPYIDAHLAEGGRLPNVTRHILGLYHGQPGAKVWRRTLSQRAHLPGAGGALLEDALAEVEGEAFPAERRRASMAAG